MNERCRFDENGNLVQQWGVLNGERHGIWRVWSANDALTLEANFENGLRQGEARKWNEDGLLVEIAHYKDDVLHGHFWSCWANGRVREEGEFRLGRRVAPFTWYDEDGRVLMALS
jgi:antitoxin component YwqK of YwqJK toxin-antitoxin module